MPTGRETPQGQCSLTPARVHMTHVCAHRRAHTHTHTHTCARAHTHTRAHPLLQTGHGLGDPLGALSGRFRLLCGGESNVSVDHPHSPESRTPPGTPPGLLAHNLQTRLQRDLAEPPPLLSSGPEYYPPPDSEGPPTSPRTAQAPHLYKDRKSFIPVGLSKFCCLVAKSCLTLLRPHALLPMGFSR